MISRMRQYVTKLLLLGAGAAIWSMGTVEVHAQRFEDVSGGTACVESGRAGVKQLAGGGYIAAGESYSAAANCGSSDIYVVRTNNNGTQVFAATYSIGVNDSALDIEEVRNDPANAGGFIVTGVTDMITPGPVLCNVGAGGRQVFLLRIDGCGNVIWLRTYGGSGDEIGWDVIEATTGDPNWGTAAGDFVVAGTSRAVNATASNAYLLRVTSAGGIIWDRTYNSRGNGDDYFYALTEATVGLATGSTGDIVAVGGTTGYASGTVDAFIVRVSGNDGTMNPLSLTHGAVAYGRGGVEDLRSVIEVKNGATAGDIVAVGRTTSTSIGLEVYLLETGPSPCAFVADRALGDNLAAADEAFGVRETIVNIGPVNGPAHIIVTGYLTPPAGTGFGAQDAFLQEFVTGTLAVVGASSLFGGANNDVGWSVNNVVALNNCITAGYIVAGYTRSPLNPAFPNDPQQLYLIKTDLAKSSSCNLTYTPVNDACVGFQRDCRRPALDSIKRACFPTTERVCRSWTTRICWSDDGTGGFPCLSQVCLCNQPLDEPLNQNGEEQGGDALHFRKP